MSSAMSPERLRAVVTELLESAVFVFAEPAEPTPWTDSGIFCGRLVMGRDQAVELCFCVPKALGLIVAANLLGTEPDEEETSSGVRDAVGEMTNMLAGILAAELFGRDVVVPLSTPEVHEETGAEHEAHNARPLTRISLHSEDGHRIDVSLLRPAVSPTSRGTPATGDAS